MKTEADSASAPGLLEPPSRSFWGTFLIYWGPVLIWMAVIFGFSTGAGSTQHTSRIIGPLLRWLIPDIPDEAIRGVQFAIRKTAHLTEYAILALLVWRARRRPFRGDTRPWSRTDALVAFAVATGFAITDEWHQSFVPSRQGQLVDVLIDSIGAALGLMAFGILGRWRRWW